jgi:hypothetical protein
VLYAIGLPGVLGAVQKEAGVCSQLEEERDDVRRGKSFGCVLNSELFDMMNKNIARKLLYLILNLVVKIVVMSSRSVFVVGWLKYAWGGVVSCRP